MDNLLDILYKCKEIYRDLTLSLFETCLGVCEASKTTPSFPVALSKIFARGLPGFESFRASKLAVPAVTATLTLDSAISPKDLRLTKEGDTVIFVVMSASNAANIRTLNSPIVVNVIWIEILLACAMKNIVKSWLLQDPSDKHLF